MDPRSSELFSRLSRCTAATGTSTGCAMAASEPASVFTLSSLWSSSNALCEEPDLPCASASAGDAQLGPPEADTQHWPRFHSVWGAQPDDAAARWRASMRWRADQRMDSALGCPQPFFHFSKGAYPHAFHKRCRDGSLLHLERADHFAALVSACAAAEVPAEEAAMHVARLNEYLASLDPRPFPGGRVVRIVDCEDLSLWQMSSSVVTFARVFARTVGAHYPERSSKILVVNAPSSFALVFSLLSSLFSRKLLDKVTVFSVAQQEAAHAALRDLVAPENLPVAYGGSCACAGPGGCWRNAPEERDLWRTVEEATPLDIRRRGSWTTDEDDGDG